MLLVAEGAVEQALDLFPRVNIRNKGLGLLGNDDRQRTIFYITAS
jgi:hypothetical protein